MNSRRGISYEDLVARFGEGDNLGDMKHKAILKKGGHCLNCTCKTALTAVLPARVQTTLRPDNFSVRVKCSLDEGRKHPHRTAAGDPSPCPTKRRHETRLVNQAKIPI